MNLETKITIYKFTPQLFTLTRNTFSLRHASCSKLLRLNPDFIAAKVARTLKTLLPEEKTTSFPFTFHPHKISYRYYVYTLRRILI